jgi:hypothetical protein
MLVSVGREKCSTINSAEDSLSHLLAWWFEFKTLCDYLALVARSTNSLSCAVCRSFSERLLTGLHLVSMRCRNDMEMSCNIMFETEIKRLSGSYIEVLHACHSGILIDGTHSRLQSRVGLGSELVAARGPRERPDTGTDGNRQSAGDCMFSPQRTCVRPWLALQHSLAALFSRRTYDRYQKPYNYGTWNWTGACSHLFVITIDTLCVGLRFIACIRAPPARVRVLQASAMGIVIRFR